MVVKNARRAIPAACSSQAERDRNGDSFGTRNGGETRKRRVSRCGMHCKRKNRRLSVNDTLSDSHMSDLFAPPIITEFDLRRGDCPQALVALPAESVDLVVTSPPY